MGMCSLTVKLLGIIFPICEILKMDDDLKKIELTISALAANILAFVYVLPPSAISVFLFIKMFGKSRFFTKDGFKSIKFGLSLKALMPYTHCSKVLGYYQFLLGVIFPAIILGILPMIFAFIFVKSWLLLYGIIFLFGAGGDLVIFFMILKHKSKNIFIMDHPQKIGCILLKKGDD